MVCGRGAVTLPVSKPETLNPKQFCSLVPLQSSAVCSKAAEFGGPAWIFGQRSFAALPDGRLLATFSDTGGRGGDAGGHRPRQRRRDGSGDQLLLLWQHQRRAGVRPRPEAATSRSCLGALSRCQKKPSRVW